MTGKPPYRVPLVAETAQQPRNGLRVASTFAGAGGSSYGYELAGYQVVWANEIVPAARACYAANHPNTILDGRDIREVQPDDILAATGLAAGELDLFDGSPPCQSFSTSGKREKGWGKVGNHADGTRQIADDLFYEYARLLTGLQPRVFVAENVSGLVKGVAKGQFKRILAALRSCGYQVRARVLDAQWLGVPQARRRLIFIGTRLDLNAEPVFPQPLPYRYSVRDALPQIIRQTRGIPNPAGSGWQVGQLKPADEPSPTITADPTDGNNRMPPSKVEALIDGESPNGAPLTMQMGAHGWFPGRIVNLSREPAPIVLAGGFGAVYMIESETALRGRVAEIAKQLRPGDHGDKVTGSGYWSLARLHDDRPAGTVQASEGKMVSTNQVHPTELRRLSIAELKRICGFPDDYVLLGSYAEQWARLGNSVPPPMMAAVAAALRGAVLR